MHEAKAAMSVHIHSRLVGLYEQLSSIEIVEKNELQNGYQTILERFHAFLVQYGDKCIIARVVSSRVVVSACHALHEDLSSLVELYKIDVLPSFME